MAGTGIEYTPAHEGQAYCVIPKGWLVLSDNCHHSFAFQVLIFCFTKGKTTNKDPDVLFLSVLYMSKVDL